MITRMFVEQPFQGYDGRFISMPPRSVVPKPKQKPHPPLWVACSPPRDDPARRAPGHRRAHVRLHRPRGGEGVGGRVLRADRVRRMRAGRLRREPEPRRRAADDAARGRGDRDRARHRRSALLRLSRWPTTTCSATTVPGITNVWDEFQAKRAEYGFAREIINADDGPLGVKILQQGLGSLRGAIGTPEQVVELVQRYEAVGVDQVIFVQQAGPEQARAHLRVARAVRRQGAAPLRRRARGARGREARAAGAGGVRARARAARAGPRTPDPGYVITPRGEPRPAQVIAAASPARSRTARRTEAGTGCGNGSSAPASRRSRRSCAAAATPSSSVRSDPNAGLRVIFKAMERAFVPAKANGFSRRRSSTS